MTDEAARLGRFSGQEISDRQATQFIGLAQGMIADGVLNDSEIEFLHKWLVANDAAHSNPLISMLVERLYDIFEDGVIDEDERADLMGDLERLTASDFELGEVLKATTLPLCAPPPELSFDGKRYCFTGTFTFGKRRICEAEVTARGAKTGNLANSTDFLVIGEYATESWKQEAFGRKIEKAVSMRDDGTGVSIISEAHWRKSLV
jgi:NAD-dependent DNA ligase